MSISFFPTTIGELPIYEDEYNAAQEILQAIRSDKNPVLLIAQPQQGKTGAMITFLDHSIRSASQNNRILEILWITNVSNNGLVEQTITRMRQAGISNKVKVVHRTGLKKVILNENADDRIIICDECHEAVKKDSNFIEFMEKIGIHYGQPKSTWTSKNTVVVSVSATPYAHVLKNILIHQKAKPYEEQIFHEVVMHISEDYYSIQDIKEAGRFYQSSPLFKKNKPSDFFAKVFEDFMDSCENNGAGYLIIRATGDKNIERIENFVSTKNIDIVRCDSQKNNISSINEILSTKIPNPCVLIIRGAFRVGQTLKTTKNIRGWVESPTANADTTAQALRCLGYEFVDGKNRRFDDTFPIYCNTKEIDDIIQFYNERNCNRTSIPSGVGNKKSSSIRRNWYVIPVMDIDYSDPSKKPTFDFVKSLLENDGFDLSGKNGLVIHSVKDNNSHDLADALTVLTGFQQQVTGKVNTYKVDEMNPNHKDSWNILCQENPEYIGKFVAVMYTTETKIHNLDEALLDDRSTFSDKAA